MAAWVAEPAFSGGDRLQETLRQIDANLGAGGHGYELRVGFFEDATYDDGTQVAYIAAIQNWGATIQRKAGSITVYRATNKRGTGFLRKGRFVKRSKANFVTTHAHGAYTITIPPRPFFTNMIANGAKHWAADLAAALRDADYDAAQALAKMGEQLVRELRLSINETNSPPLAASTVRRKGFDKPLIDTGTMWNQVAYTVTSASSAEAQPQGTAP